MNKLIMLSKSIQFLIKLGLILFAFVTPFLLRPSNATILDYQLWFTFLCAGSALILDFREHYRDFGYASTLALNVMTLAFFVIGRFGITLSLLRFMFSSCFKAHNS